MKKVCLENNNYELIKEYKDGFSIEDTERLYTDYFYDYDYILGDWSYGKLRLKGFCSKENNKLNETNNFDNVEDYIKDRCAYECKYFILKKVN